nr:MAG TPA: hypothetical protein [Caudoviricetes sp.]
MRVLHTFLLTNMWVSDTLSFIRRCYFVSKDKLDWKTL